VKLEQVGGFAPLPVMFEVSFTGTGSAPRLVRSFAPGCLRLKRAEKRNYSRSQSTQSLAGRLAEQAWREICARKSAQQMLEELMHGVESCRPQDRRRCAANCQQRG
jgi:hypothetical protein